MDNNNNKQEEFLRKILQELQEMEQESNDEDNSDELSFELELLFNGVRTKPVFYD